MHACSRRLETHVVPVPRKPVVWEDLTTGKFHAVNNETGEKVACDRNGRPLPEFHNNISGIASTKERKTIRLKVRVASSAALSIMMLHTHHASPMLTPSTSLSPLTHAGHCTEQVASRP